MLPDETIKQFIVAAHGNLAEVKSRLTQHPELLGVSYDWGANGGREDALQAAGHMGSQEIALYLLDQGAPLTVFAAAMLGREDDVRRFLAEQEALANTPGVHGISLMWHAALSGNPRVAEAVHEHGGRIDPLVLHAAVSSGQVEMVQWIMAHGADDASVKNFQGQMPLEAAEARGHNAIADYLREHTR